MRRRTGLLERVRAGRTAEWRRTDADYERPPRVFPPGPWVVLPGPMPRFAPSHIWREFGAQQFRDPQQPYAGRRGPLFRRERPLAGAGYRVGAGHGGADAIQSFIIGKVCEADPRLCAAHGDARKEQLWLAARMAADFPSMLG